MSAGSHLATAHMLAALSHPTRVCHLQSASMLSCPGARQCLQPYSLLPHRSTDFLHTRRLICQHGQCSPTKAETVQRTAIKEGAGSIRAQGSRARCTFGAISAVWMSGLCTPGAHQGAAKTGCRAKARLSSRCARRPEPEVTRLLGCSDREDPLCLKGPLAPLC